VDGRPVAKFSLIGSFLSRGAVRQEKSKRGKGELSTVELPEIVDSLWLLQAERRKIRVSLFKSLCCSIKYSILARKMDPPT